MNSSTRIKLIGWGLVNRRCKSPTHQVTSLIFLGIRIYFVPLERLQQNSKVLKKVMGKKHPILQTSFQPNRPLLRWRSFHRIVPSSRSYRAKAGNRTRPTTRWLQGWKCRTSQLGSSDLCLGLRNCPDFFCQKWLDDFKGYHFLFGTLGPNICDDKMWETDLTPE